MRSGLVESTHRGHVVLSAPGREPVAWGDVDHPFFLRSAAKPIQATVCHELGAELDPTAMAVACSSHGGEPVHVALVRRMLADAGLGEKALRCPPDRPMNRDADRRLAASGVTAPAAVLHNCSGKHAAMLQACVAQGWDLDYLRPTHPLQEAILATIADLTGLDPRPTGVDGCGVPTLRTTVGGLAVLFAALGRNERLAAAHSAMHRYPALTAGTDRPETAIAVALGAAAKGGAMGALGVVLGDGTAVAVKSSDGSLVVAAMAAVAALVAAGRLASVQAATLAAVASPPVLGGGHPAGHMEPTLGDDGP